MLDIIRRNSQSWAVKVIFALIIIVFVYWGANTTSSESDKTLAKVNGESIYRRDLYERYQEEALRLRQEGRDLSALGEDEQGSLERMLLNQLIIRAMMRQEAERLGLGISNMELSNLVSGVPMFQDEHGRFDKNIYRETLALMSMTPGRYERRVSEDLLLNKFQNYVTGAANLDEAGARRLFDFEMERRGMEYLSFRHADYVKGLNPGEAELMSFYTENSERWREPVRVNADYLLFDLPALSSLRPVSEEDARVYYESRLESFVRPAAYHSRHILVRLPLSANAGETAIQEARQKAENILAELRAGAKFVDLARKYSDDALTSENGGDMGWAEHGQLDAAYELALEMAAPGLIPEPVRSFNGFHVIELLEKRPESSRPLEEVQEDILIQLREDAAYAVLQDTLSEVEEATVRGQSLEETSAFYKTEIRNSGRLELPALAALLELPENALAGLNRLQAGETLPTPLEQAQGFVVIRLREYQPSRIPDFADLRPQVLEDFMAVEGARLAHEEALKELAALRADPDKKPSAKLSSGTATRFAGLPDLGWNPELTKALYLARPGEWLDTPHRLAEATILARLKNILPPDENNWQQEGAAYTATLNQLRRNEIFNIYLERLQKESKITLEARSGSRLLGR
ncbi:MAG: SurA N-terminal domain-containing protein [Desulfovibrionaceae bacterium]|nr:SurA N-terminal domain-containing protein [Desulfovibrionaceae bacterium]